MRYLVMAPPVFTKPSAAYVDQPLLNVRTCCLLEDGFAYVLTHAKKNARRFDRAEAVHVCLLLQDAVAAAGSDRVFRVVAVPR